MYTVSFLICARINLSGNKGRNFIIFSPSLSAVTREGKVSKGSSDDFRIVRNQIIRDKEPSDDESLI